MTFRLRKLKSVLFLFTALILIGAVTVTASGILADTAPTGAGILLGDADDNGDVNLIDVSCIQRTLAGLSVPDGIDETAADVDHNNAVEIIDATYIQRWLTSMDTPYPIGEQPTEAPTTAPTQRPTDSEGWSSDIFRP